MRKGEEGGGRKRKEKKGEGGNTRKEERGGRSRKSEEKEGPNPETEPCIQGQTLFPCFFFQRCPKSLVCGKTIPNVMPQTHSMKTWEGNSAYLKRADDGDLDIHMSTQQPSVQLAVEKIHFTEKQH